MDILQRLKRYGPSTDFNWSSFVTQLHHQSLSKDHYLIRPGEEEKRLYFLDEGIVRFYVDKGDRELTFDFAFSGSFFCAFTSFLTGQPVQYFVQALTNCQLYYIEKAALETLYQTHPEGLAIGKWAAEQQFLRKSARELSLLIETAEERYLSLLQNQPGLLHLIPLKYLASYIGVTPQALSRIRKRISAN